MSIKSPGSSLILSPNIGPLTPPSSGISSGLSNLFIRHGKPGGQRCLAQVLKVIKIAIKSNEASRKRQRQAANTIKSWLASSSDEPVKELLVSVGDVAEQIWNAGSEVLVRLESIQIKLNDLKLEEEMRDRIARDCKLAEKAYYRALYKTYPRAEVDTLAAAMKSLQAQHRSAQLRFRNTMIIVTKQCLTLFFEQYSASCGMQQKLADRIICMISDLDDTPHSVLHEDELNECDFISKRHGNHLASSNPPLNLPLRGQNSQCKNSIQSRLSRFALTLKRMRSQTMESCNEAADSAEDSSRERPLREALSEPFDEQFKSRSYQEPFSTPDCVQPLNLSNHFDFFQGFEDIRP